MKNRLGNSIGQAGFTLVEIMVAITIGLVLLGGVVQIFVSNSQAYRVQDDLARVQENGRFAIDMIARNLRKAGFKMTAWDDDIDVFAADTTQPAPSAKFASSGQVVAGTVSGGSVKAGTDAITFRFQQSADNTLRDCVNQGNTGGAPTVAGQIIVNTYYIDSQDTLRCRSSHGNSDFPLLDGIENMDIAYGIDSGGDLTADKYVGEANVAAGEWDDVVSVRISLVSVSSADFLTDSSQTFTFNGSSVTDKKIRRVFTGTVNLRNITQ